MTQLPSLFLTAWGMLVFWLAGDKRRIAWAAGMFGQVFWASYAIWLRQWGLLVGCGFYFGVYLRNWLKWASTAVVPVEVYERIPDSEVLVAACVDQIPMYRRVES